MKTFEKKLLFLPAVLTAVSVLCAGEADERHLGDRAFYSDDFSTAVSHYKSAQKLSENSFFSEAWAKNTLRLGKALLLSGDIAGAKAVLNEFQHRQPMRSSGTLEADILAAEKKFAEAEKLYKAMELSSDGELSAAAAFGRAVMTFDQGKLAEAEQIFRSINPVDARLKAAVGRELAYTLIQQEKYDEALAVLSGCKDAERINSHEVLTALAQVKSGKLADFKENWHELLKNNPRYPDRRCCELLLAAADAFEKQNDRALSAELLKAADRFAVNSELRQKIFKQLINLESSFDPESAAESARDYAEAFPDAPDRFKVVAAAADILADTGKYPAACELISKLLNDKKLPQDIRYSSAANGAVFAEKAGNTALAGKFYTIACESAHSDKDKVLSLRKYAAFLMRQKKYHDAVTALSKAVKTGGKKSGDDLKEELLDAAVKDHNAAVITLTARALENSPVPRYRCRAHYELAELADKKQDFAIARKEYLASAAVRGGGQYALAGKFGAARAAFQLGDFKNCANEAIQLALANPKMKQAPQALYLGYRAARKLNDANLKNLCANYLLTKYHDSESYAVYALQNAADRVSANRDPQGAIADLEELEEKFVHLPEIVTEAMLMRGGILKSSGKPREALECIASLIAKYPDTPSAYYAAMLAGNINFSMLNYTASLKSFNQAAAMRPAGLENELARSMAVESMFQLAAANPAMNKEAVIECDKLIAASKFPHIRMEMRYRKGAALQKAGRELEALTVYEQLLNEALECAAKGQMFDRNRCLRGAEAALQIVNSSNKRSLYIRALRIIERCKRLKLDRAGLDLETVRAELIQKFSSKRKRR